MAKRCATNDLLNDVLGAEEKPRRRRVAVAGQTPAPVAAVKRGGPSGPSGPQGGPSGPSGPKAGGPSGPSGRKTAVAAPEVKRRKRIGQDTMDLLG